MKKIMGLLILSSYIFISCGTNNKFDEFREAFNNKEYNESYIIYDENVRDENFKNKVQEFSEDLLINFEKFLSVENHLEIEKEVNVIARFYNDSRLDNLRSKIEECKLEKIEELDEDKIIKETIKEDNKENELNVSEIEELLKNKSEEQNKTNKYGDFYYKTYKNERYGYSLEYPSFLVKKIPAQNVSGLTMTNPEEEVFLNTFAINNIFEKSIDDFYFDRLNLLDNHGYTYLGKSSYVITWVEGDKSFYEYSIIGKGSQNGFCIESPTEDAKIFDEIITKVYESFKSGDLENAH